MISIRTIAESFMIDPKYIISDGEKIIIHKTRIVSFCIDKLEKAQVVFDTCIIDCIVILNDGKDNNFSFISCDFSKNINVGFRYQTVTNNFSFDTCVFYEKINLNLSKIEHQLSFKQCLFYENIQCCKTTFVDFSFIENLVYGSVDFRNAHFEKFCFRNTSFFEYVIFDRAEFFALSELVFENIRFEGGVSFESFQHFGELKFLENLFKKTIVFYPFNNQKIYFQSCFFEGSIVSNLDFLQHIKDPLRERKMLSSIKAGLIKGLNNLDATSYAVKELHCKEYELKIKPKKSLREWIDWFQLFFYRNISDHHTDLPQIFCWVLATIACFGVSLGFSRYGLDFGEFAIKHHLTLLFTLFSKIAMWFHIDIQYVCAWCYCLFFLSLFFSISRFVSSVIVLCLIIAVQPKYILGIGGFIGGNIQAQGMGENFLFVIYSLIMFLMLFSLQKTACKNSIIPR